MNEPKDNTPKPPPSDWHLHIERDLSWMLNENVTPDERKRFADRIRDMVLRVRWHESRQQEALHLLVTFVNTDEKVCPGCDYDNIPSKGHYDGCPLEAVLKALGMRP